MAKSQRLVGMDKLSSSEWSRGLECKVVQDSLIHFGTASKLQGFGGELYKLCLNVVVPDITCP